MLRGAAKITEIETFLNQVINEKRMVEHDTQYKDNHKELNSLVKLKRTLMKKLSDMKHAKKTQITGLQNANTSGGFLEKFVNKDYTISETELNKLVNDKHTLMKRLFETKEKLYNQNTRITKEKQNNENLRNVLEVNINNSSKNIKEKQDALKSDIMSQNKLFQIKENEYRKKQYFIYICKHITAFSILSLLILLFMKTDHVSSATARNLILSLFVILIVVIILNHLYYIRRNAVYFHRYNWRNRDTLPGADELSCSV